MSTRLSGSFSDRPSATTSKGSYYLAVAQPEIFTVDFDGLTGNNVAGKYFTAADFTDSVYFWFDTGSSTDPAAGARGVQVVLDGDAPSEDIATALAAIEDENFVFSVEGTVVTVTNASAGPRINVNTGDSGVNVSTLQQGSNAVVYESNGVTWNVRIRLERENIVGETSGLDADKPPSSNMIGWIYHTSDTERSYEGFPSDWFLQPRETITSENEISFLGGTVKVLDDAGNGYPAISVDQLVNNMADRNANIDLAHRKLIAEDGETVLVDYSSPLGPVFSGLQTTDPGIEGMLWNDSGILTISVGS